MHQPWRVDWLYWKISELFDRPNEANEDIVRWCCGGEGAQETHGDDKLIFGVEKQESARLWVFQTVQDRYNSPLPRLLSKGNKKQVAEVDKEHQRTSVSHL
jgi:hypothetical protein